jgi:tetratricopeptide (TPR) repeat protein
MKFSFITIALLIATAVFAQSQTAPPPKTLPGDQTAPAPPQARSQAEYQAFQGARQQTSAAEMEPAVTRFNSDYPQSELRPLLAQDLMERFYKERNFGKTLQWARVLLALEPNNPVGLVRAASILAETTDETSPDRDGRLREAQTRAQTLIKTVDQTIAGMFNPRATPEQLQSTKNLLLQLAYSALGKADLDLKQYAEAEGALKQALKLKPADGVSLYRLALALDYQQHYDEALDAANRALENAQNAVELVSSIQQERDRLQQLAHNTAANPPRN